MIPLRGDSETKSTMWERAETGSLPVEFFIKHQNFTARSHLSRRMRQTSRSL